MIERSHAQQLADRIQRCLECGDYIESSFLFDDLMEQLLSRLLARARFWGAGEDANDWVAETFLAVFKALEAGKTIRSVEALAFKVLSNTRVDDLRRKNSQKRQPSEAAKETHSGKTPHAKRSTQDEDEPSEDDEAEHTDSDQPDDLNAVGVWRNGAEKWEVPDAQSTVPFEVWETRSVLNPLLSALPEIERQVLILRYYCEWSVEETAQRLEVSPDQVKKRCQAALKLARQAAEKEGVNFEDLI